MKKFFLTLVAVCILAIPQIVFAADVPDFRSVNPSSIVLEWDADENYRTSVRERVYKCSSASAAENFVTKYVAMLMRTGYFTLDEHYRHKESNGTFERYSFQYTGSKKIVRRVTNVGSPCSVDVEWTVGDKYVFISVAAGITYGNE